MATIVITSQYYHPDTASGSSRIAFDEAVYLARQGNAVWLIAQDVAGNGSEYHVENGLHVIRYPRPEIGPWHWRFSTSALNNASLPRDPAPESPPEA